jgi:hypothetical protein
MRTSLPLLLALTTATTATTITPLLARRFFPQQVLSKGDPLPSVCSVDISGASTDFSCGDLCLPHSYTCCPDKLGGCPQDASCVKGDNGVYGCCPEGGKCTGDGKVLSSATTKASATSAKSSTETSETATAGDSKPTNTDAETTSAGPTPTGDKPADGTPTPTGGAAVYVPGSMGVVGAMVAGLFVL